jgi:hypothetical protein
MCDEPNTELWRHSQHNSDFHCGVIRKSCGTATDMTKDAMFMNDDIHLHAIAVSEKLQAAHINRT